MKQVIIGICDDQAVVLQSLQNMLCGICEGLGAKPEIYTFTDGNEMLNHIDEMQIVFLDIEMPQMDGIELGQRIKEQNPGCKIIMATGMVERFKEAFQIRALRFVTKPFVKEEIKEAMEAALEGVYLSKSVDAYAERNKYEIPEEEIVYVRAYNGYSELCVGEKIFRRDCSLSEIEGMLNERLFARINRDMVVNLNFIEKYNDENVIIGYKEFRISRRRKKEFERKYMEFDLKYRRLIRG